MAAFNRPTNATYETHDNVFIDTHDNEDHTFCGIMFPIKCKDLLPVDHLVIKSVSVRGLLGPLTVWVSKKDANYDLDRKRRHRTRSGRDSYLRRSDPHYQEGKEGGYRIPLKPSSWNKVYERTHKPCLRGDYTDLVFEEPVFLEPGEMRALYIHSTLPNDQAIVYDNSYYGSSAKRFEDDKLCILTGRAHVSPTCFGKDPIWGWGNAWRDRREFVGRLVYGTVYKLWNPEVQPKFGSHFQNGTRSLFLCQRRFESPMSMLPDEAIFYILNMCKWDWFDDCSDTMKDRKKREKARKQLLEQEEQEAKPAVSMDEDEKMDAKPSANDAASSRCVCNRSSGNAGETHGGDKTTGLSDAEEEDDDEDEEYVDASDDSDDDDDTRMNDDGVVDEVMVDAEDAEIESDDSSDDEDDYHRANRRYFGFQDPDSDEEETERASEEAARQGRIRRQFARVHVFRALAAMEDGAINQY